ncbi:MAG TPA: asparagine synthetase B, partial [Gemmatimonadales bacterium]|nr:asparagine synthetase B [Gemmatimonadales bacterium]
MAATLAHRGPDDLGSHAAGQVALGFRRLSILDLTPAGHQPIVSPDGRVAMVFNGEIYNFAELRQELRARGHAFQSTGDSEVLLAAYLEWGRECLSRLNGMWAFLIHDTRNDTVFGSRDRFGVKPLYHVSAEGRHYFASEIKALQAVLPVAREVAWPRLAAFLAAGNLEALPADTTTFFSAVHEIEPGTWLEVTRDGHLRTGRYWNLPEESRGGGGSPVDEFEEILLDSVSLRLRSDVPVGVALSGG